MATFMLVHGSWHGAWCWDRVTPLLEAQGHRAFAIDLPGHGDDHTWAIRATLDRYAGCIREHADGLTEKPILVGHSMGGMAITQAAANAPETFGALVYLCAFVPDSGECLLELAQADPESLIATGARLRTLSVHFDPERTRAVFYGDCSREDAAWAAARLRPDPLRALRSRLVMRRPTTLPCGYIECTRDRAISIGHQRAMHGRTSFDRIITMESDHSPFLSAPAELAGHLGEMASLAETD